MAEEKNTIKQEVDTELFENKSSSDNNKIENKSDFEIEIEEAQPFIYDYKNLFIRKRPELSTRKYAFRFGDDSNYVELSNNGTITKAGTATTWDDLRVPGLQVRTGASAPELVAFAPATTNLLVYGFDGASTTEQVYFSCQLPHSYKEGSDIYPHIHWSPTTTDAGNVRWYLEYTWVNINGTAVAPTTIGVTQAAGGTAWKHNIASFAAVSGTGKTISSMFIARLYRNPGDAADTYGADAAFLEFDIHFEQDTIGSQTATSKT